MKASSLCSLYLAVCFGFLVAEAASAQRPSVTSVRGRAKEDSAAELRCRLALDEKRYSESLRQAEWLNWEKDRAPVVDWTSHAVILVSPQIYLENHRLAFEDLKLEDAKVVVHWMFREGKPDLVLETSGPGVSTHGSTAIGPEILAIIVPRTVLEGKKIICKGPKRKE